MGAPFTREMLPTFQMSSCHVSTLNFKPASHRHPWAPLNFRMIATILLGHGRAELCPTTLRKSLLVHFCAPCPQIGGWVGPGKKIGKDLKDLRFFVFFDPWKVVMTGPELFLFLGCQLCSPEVLHYPYCGLPASECTECTSAEPATHVIDIHISCDFRMQKMCCSWRGRRHCVCDSAIWHPLELVKLARDLTRPNPHEVAEVGNPQKFQEILGGIHPGRLTAGTYKSPIWKGNKGTWSSINLQGIMFQPLIFQGSVV